MADNKVIFEVITTSKGTTVVAKQTDDLAKSVNRADKNTKKLDKSQAENYGRQKQGVIQTANSTKNFSKLSQTIGGSGGTSLVGAYATLAANVFAATAAFNALSRAADFVKLQEGLTIIGNQSGRSLGILTDNLREATGMALTMEEAMSAAALGISGGFGASELEGLAKVAKGASLTLGRSLPDAFDRLTRGAIKLEPEILDELGIMVRLDDAVEKYAAQLGKGANSLTQMERRQAFMNEILVQGEAKFGDIADAVDSTPYAKLGATFGDLTKDIFTFVNETAMLGDLVGFLANSTTALSGAMLIFGSTIATQIVPALGQMAEKSALRAKKSSMEAKALQSDAKREIRSLKAKRKEFKLGSNAYNKAKKSEGTATDRLKRSIKQLDKQARLRNNNLKKELGWSEAKRKAKKAELAQIKEQIILEGQLLKAESKRTATGFGALVAKADAKLAKKAAKTMSQYTSGEIGLGAALAANFKNWRKTGEKLQDATKKQGLLTRANKSLGSSFKFIGTQLGFLVAGFVKFLPLIGLVAVVAGAAFLAFDKFYNTKEQKAYNKSIKELKTILDGLPEKAKEYNAALMASGPPALANIKSTQILSNSIKEINEGLKEAVKNRKELAKAGREQGGPREITENERADIFGGEQLLFSPEGAAVVYENAALTAGEAVSRISDILIPGLDGVSKDSLNTLAGLLAIDKTPEFDTLKTLLTNEIPQYAGAAKKAFPNIAKLLAAGKSEEAMEAIRQLSQDSETQFGKLGTAVQGFAQSLKDAEKIGSQFMQKFLPKTSMTDILNVFSGFKKEIALIKEEAKKADPSNFIGATAAQFSGADASMTGLLGGDFKRDKKAFLDAKEARDLAQDQVDVERKGILGMLDKIALRARERELARAGIKLEKTGTEAVNDTFDALVKMQDAELNKKKLLEQINQLRKVEKSIVGRSAQSGLIQNKIMDDRMAIREKDFSVANDILGKELGLTKEQLTQGKTLEHLKALREQTGDLALTEQEKAQIDLQIQESKNIELSKMLNTAQATFNIGMAAVEVSKMDAKLLKQKLDFQNKLNKAEQLNTLAGGAKTVNPIQSLQNQVKLENQKVQAAIEKAKIDKESNKLQLALLKAQLLAYKKMMPESDIDFDGIIKDAETSFGNFDTILQNQIDKGSEAGVNQFKKRFQDVFGKDLISDGLSKSLQAGILGANSGIGGMNDMLVIAADQMRSFGADMESLFGEEGKVIAALGNFSATLAEIGPSISQSFKAIDDATKTIYAEDGTTVLQTGITADQAAMARYAAVAGVASQVLGGFSEVIRADASRRTAEIDKQIEAEERMDGKSAQSVAKIKALEAKKESIAKKAFERDKKMQMARVIASTAAGVMGVVSGVKSFWEAPIAIATAGMIAAMGAAQLAMIAKTSYQGGGSSVEAPRTALTLGGGRSNAVDVSQRASMGEQSYLRGERGVGTTANNFTPGGAMGRKGYANGGDGITVGERGPEVITPAQPIDITPNYALGGQSQNINFNISAVDGASVQNMLNEQQGNIIAMIRQAANDNGEGFLETVDPTVYGGGG